jgi:plasmid stability protein
VTLDEDVAAALKRAVRERGTSFKAVLNDALRAGLRSEAQPQTYRLPARPMGLRPGIDLDRALRLAGELEDEEIVRKLALRK